VRKCFTATRGVGDKLRCIHMNDDDEGAEEREKKERERERKIQLWMNNSN
jgi:hypothetical protein